MTEDQVEERILAALEDFRWGLYDGVYGNSQRGYRSWDDCAAPTAYYNLGYNSGGDIRNNFPRETHGHHDY